MKIVPFNYVEHAEHIRNWGAKHGFPLPAREFLPDSGLVVDDTASGFLYITNSKMAWIEWVFSNPEKTPEERTQGLDALMNALEKMAIVYGKKILLSASATDAYRRVLERNGFKETDSIVSHHMKGIG